MLETKIQQAKKSIVALVLLIVVALSAAQPVAAYYGYQAVARSSSSVALTWWHFNPNPETVTVCWKKKSSWKQICNVNQTSIVVNYNSNVTGERFEHLVTGLQCDKKYKFRIIYPYGSGYGTANDVERTFDC